MTQNICLLGEDEHGDAVGIQHSSRFRRLMMPIGATLPEFTVEG